jgi:hypothetical protein
MKAKSRALRGIPFLASVLAGLCFWALGGSPQSQLQDYEPVKKITVPGNQAWTDTGLDIQRGQEFYFVTSGTISLQKDNPIAGCGPDGLNRKTQQQPIPEQNLGALVGKILEKVETATDKQTGEKTQKEVGQVFFIGKENIVSLPADGRLLLGINELVVGDNDGFFEVAIYRKK